MPPLQNKARGDPAFKEDNYFSIITNICRSFQLGYFLLFQKKIQSGTNCEMLLEQGKSRREATLVSPNTQLYKSTTLHTLIHHTPHLLPHCTLWCTTLHIWCGATKHWNTALQTSVFFTTQFSWVQCQFKCRLVQQCASSVPDKEDYVVFSSTSSTEGTAGGHQKQSPEFSVLHHISVTFALGSTVHIFGPKKY